MKRSEKLMEQAVDLAPKDLKYDYDADNDITAADARLAARQEHGMEPMTATGQQYNALSLANQYLDQYRTSKFNYDVYSDPVYNQAREAYIRQGQLAAKDVQAQAAGLTGGYGNSYGAMAAQQQYNQALQNMNDIIPQLEQNAYGRWQDEQARNLSLAQIYLDRENQMYNRSYNEAVLGAQYKDYAGLHDLGIDTGHYESLEQAEEDWNNLLKDRQMKEWDQADTTFAWNIALNAAQFKDYSKLNELGIDTSSQQKQDLIDRAITWAQYGDYSLLAELGVDTDYLQQLQNYELALKDYELQTAAYNLGQLYASDDTSGSSGGSGGSRSSGGSRRRGSGKESSNYSGSESDDTQYESIAGHFNAQYSAEQIAKSQGYEIEAVTATGVIARDPKDGSKGEITVGYDGTVTVKEYKDNKNKTTKKLNQVK